MTSFAQNNEDVVLARALGSIEHGFYVDIGAFDPSAHSVTKHFYELGWRGINVEPVREQYERFVAERPEDINLEVGVLDREGSTEFWVSNNVGASTFQSELVSADSEWNKTAVKVTTLAAICRDHVGDRTIDFLKIDAEGSETEVIRGGDWQRWRPRVVVVESTRPHSREQAHEAWEPLLLDAGYEFALFDGLNRFYATSDDPKILELLDRPACVFDEFVTNEVALLYQQLSMKDEYIAGLERALDERSASGTGGPRRLRSVVRRLSR